MFHRYLRMLGYDDDAPGGATAAAQQLCACYFPGCSGRVAGWCPGGNTHVMAIFLQENNGKLMISEIVGVLL